GWTWVEMGIEDWRPECRYHLIFSNAALHWVANHGELFPRLLSHLASDGVLAVQMPNNFLSPANRGMKKVAADPRWAGALDHAAENTFVEPAALYYDVLRKIASHLEIWETEYLQIMDGPHAVLDWLRSTAMRTYVERLSGEEQRGYFEELCLAEFERSYPANDDGKVLFPYRRLFILAYR
ncbi:MAG: trans-aconitate 2-methyltransferase, partial [Candidatus Angelobacter sp.]